MAYVNDLIQIDPVALRTLAAAVRLGTFEATARDLHVTPSAVSQRIKSLETRVGRVLLHRVKPLEPTEAGRVLVRLAAQRELLEREALAELVEEGDESVAAYTSIPIAVSADALYGWVVQALAAVQARHRVVFELVREDQTRTTERLRRGDVMAAITSEPRPVPGCRVQRLVRMRYVAVATPDFHAHHFVDGVGSTTLAKAPVMVFDRSDTLQHDFIRRLTRRHLTPPVTYIPSVREFDDAVRTGLGWGMLLERDVGDDLQSGRLVELVPGKRPDIPLYWQHWKLGSTVMADLTEAVAAAALTWAEGGDTLRTRSVTRLAP